MERMFAEEENLEIQEMIARFYDKFDELHEHSINKALAKSPNKQQVLKEIKYKIPQKWTGKFHKFDVIPIDIYRNQAINNERGRVNKQQMIDAKLKIVQEYEKMKQ